MSTIRLQTGSMRQVWGRYKQRPIQFLNSKITSLFWCSRQVACKLLFAFSDAFESVGQLFILGLSNKSVASIERWSYNLLHCDWLESWNYWGYVITRRPRRLQSNPYSVFSVITANPYSVIQPINLIEITGHSIPIGVFSIRSYLIVLYRIVLHLYRQAYCHSPLCWFIFMQPDLSSPVHRKEQFGIIWHN